MEHKGTSPGYAEFACVSSKWLTKLQAQLFVSDMVSRGHSCIMTSKRIHDKSLKRGQRRFLFRVRTTGESPFNDFWDKNEKVVGKFSVGTKGGNGNGAH